jgi:hypothetical protein
MADIDLKTETPDATLPSTGFLFGADSQAAASPSVYSTQAVATTLLGSTTLSGATITANAPVLDLAQTWNNAAVTFTGAKFNVTDTASNAASLLMDLQVGGTSVFAVRKDNRIGIPSISFIQFSNSQHIFLGANASTVLGRFNSNGLTVPPTSTIGFTDGTPDLILGRRAAANLRLGAADAAAPVAQTLSVQGVVAGTTNTAGANLTITGSQGTGTGAGGSIVFQVAPAGSSGTAQNALATAWQISGAGNFLAGTDNTYDIGAQGATRPRNIFAGGTVVAQSQFNANFQVRLVPQADGILQITNNATNNFGRLQFGGSTDSFPSLKRSSTSLIVRLADDSANAPLESASVKTDAPAGGTSGTWKLGVAATVSPTSPNRTIEVDIGGTIYYIAAKTTND